jgi:hypothetical protein
MEPTDQTVKSGAVAESEDVQQQQPVDLPKKRSSTRRYTTTAKKIAANRDNARRSTGPRTDAGKLAARLNPLTHGILAKEIIDSARILGESPEQYESLLAGLVESLKPVGTAEELAVQDIAVTLIRRARALRAETAEIENAQREADIREQTASLRLGGLAPQFPGSSSAALDILRSPDEVRKLRCLLLIRLFKQTTSSSVA